MRITINISLMSHNKEKSFYNNNYYSYGNMGIELLQHCQEEYDTYDYYLVEGDKKIFLGSADDSDEFEIDFLRMYT